MIQCVSENILSVHGFLGDDIHRQVWSTLSGPMATIGFSDCAKNKN